MKTLLHFDGVVAGYGRGDILRGFQLEVPGGAVTCLVGPNGAGKSTLLKTLSGLLKPRAGRIVFDGRNIAGLRSSGVAILLVEQNARAGLAAADYGAVLDGGRVAIAGRGSTLLADPRLGELYLGGAATVAANGGAARD